MTRSLLMMLVLVVASAGVGGCTTGSTGPMGDSGSSCQPTECVTEVSDLEAAVAALPGVERVVSAKYSEAKALRREASVYLRLELTQEYADRGDEVADEVLRATWESEVAPLGSLDLYYQPAGSDQSQLKQEVYSLALHEDEYAEKWGARTTG